MRDEAEQEQNPMRSRERVEVVVPVSGSGIFFSTSTPIIPGKTSACSGELGAASSPRSSFFQENLPEDPADQLETSPPPSLSPSLSLESPNHDHDASSRSLPPQIRSTRGVQPSELIFKAKQRNSNMMRLFTLPLPPLSLIPKLRSFPSSSSTPTSSSINR